MNEPAAIEWCVDAAAVARLSRFFVENADPAYISHGELQLGRAIDEHHWAADLEELIRVELANIVGDVSGSRKILTVHVGDVCTGLAILRFETAPPSPYAILEDLLVARSERSSGLGSKMLGLIEDECRRVGCRRIFLESGIGNGQAHGFFQRAGFATCSVVMTKSL
jgi:GNAT superfamily N-acetyltransferase